jgi:pilus assembly protein CpaB
VAKLFMSNMRVLAIGAAPERSQKGQPISAAVASIEVTPEQSERLAIAAAHGALQLVLRGYGDPDSISTGGAMANDVLTDIRRSRTVPVREQTARRTTRRTTPEPAPQVVAPPPAPVVQLPPPKPRPDTLTVKVFRCVTKSEDVKFQKDTAAKDSTRGRP